MGIMVCTDDGKRMQTGRAWGRGILKGLCLLPYIGAIPMVISMITVGASDKNRALHDMAVKTLVVRRKPANIFPTMPYIPPQPQTVEQALT
ncbi:MAG: RDD family protein [Thermoleophilia bacterium]|nr:RDD family protein [Thermoleophilia bacterium]